MKKLKDYKSTLALIKMYRLDSAIFQFGKNIAFYICVPFFIICMLVFMFSVNEYRKKNKEEFIAVSSYVNSDISNTLEIVEKNTFYISSNRVINEYLNIDDFDNYNHRNYCNYIDTLGILDSILISSKNIMDIQLYSYASDCVISAMMNGKSYDHADTAWYDYIEKIGVTNFYVGENGKLYVVRDINNKSGMAIFTVKCSSFLKNYNDYGMILKNKDGEVFFTTDESLDFPDKVGDFEQNGYLYSVKSYGDIQTLLCKQTGTKYLRKNMIILFTACFFCAGIFAFILIIILSFISYKNIEDIINAIHNNDFKEKNENSNEISYIIKNIRRISNENNDLENTTVKNFLEIKKLNSVVLQNQISPHFLMNTLNTVNVIILSIVKKKNDATRAVGLLSELFGDVLNTNVYTFTIEEEISYCEKYLAIEKILDDSFDVQFDIDDDIKDITIPKLLIQPIIENSIRHGIKYLDYNEQGEIRVEAKKDDNNIIIRVSDNGPCADSSVFDEINAKLKEALENTGENYKDGLFNTNKRIKLLYGESYGTVIERKGEYTVVTITLPSDLGE